MHPSFPLGAAAALSLSTLCGARAGEPAALTIYNQQFAVVRERIALNLTPGVNEVTFSETTAHLEPDSVMLRDPEGRRQLRILEQNFRNDPISQELLLSIFEGQTIDFLIDKDRTVPGRIVRSGYVPHPAAWQQYGRYYYQAQAAMTSGGSGQPIVEVDGKLRFGLPGQPLFPSLADDTILKPTLTWKLETDSGGPLTAELAYVTGGMSWTADYNLVEAAEADRLDLLGWVTIDNQSGRAFEDARIKLLAGEVKKLQGDPNAQYLAARGRFAAGGMPEPAVTEKAFDEYHLYTLSRSTTLRDRQTKQVEFLRADGIASQRIYVYDGAELGGYQYQSWSRENLRNEPAYGNLSHRKVWVMREFKNTKENQLGTPLPAGRLRFYRKDDDGRLEFIGENNIDHTPQGETVRVYTGNAFDLVGERRQTHFEIDHNERRVDESFEIKVRNRKREPAEIRVVEHLYRWYTWEIREASREHETKDSSTIEFRVPLKPDEEATIHYAVRYTW